MLAVALGVLGGAAVTRLTGLGFALMASPLLILSLGPFQGVLLCNLLNLMASLAMLATHWRHVQWRRVALLLIPAPVVIPAGALLVQHLPTAPLSVLIGVLLLVAVALVARGRSARLLAGTSGAFVAGASYSALNVLAGVGGPALALYGASQRWAGRSFVATVPACSIAVNGLSVVSKGFPSASAAEMALLAGALLVGSLLGEWLARRVGGRHAQPLLLALAAAGATAAIVKGALDW